MANLNTRYLGLELKNPILVGSSGITSNIDVLRRCQDAGAGGVVLRSVFEDEVRREYDDTVRDHMEAGFLEAAAYRRPELSTLAGGRQYLDMVHQAAGSLKIPVIASINCSTYKNWGPFAKEIEKAGAHALELNMHQLSASAVRSGDHIEQLYADALESVRRHTSIPLAVKLPAYFTNVAQVAFQMELDGARGLVLFTRPFEPDIDIENLEVKGGVSLSNPGDYKMSLRWTALLFGRVNCDLCASSGIHDGQTIVKQVLAGASAVQIVSALYKGDLNVIADMLRTVSDWMERHNYARLDEFRGLLSQSRSESPHLYEKTQYSWIHTSA